MLIYLLNKYIYIYMNSFEKKYLKYKNKYINLKKYNGGSFVYDQVPLLNSELNNMIIYITSMDGTLMKYKYYSLNRELCLQSDEDNEENDKIFKYYYTKQFENTQPCKYFHIIRNGEKIISGFVVSKKKLLIIDNICNINDFQLEGPPQNTTISYNIVYIDPTNIFFYILGEKYIENMKIVLLKYLNYLRNLENPEHIDDIKDSNEYKKLFNFTYTINFHNIYYLMCFLYSKNFDYIFSYNFINFGFKFFELFEEINHHEIIGFFFDFLINGLYNSINYLDDTYVNKIVIKKKILCVMKSIFIKFDSLIRDSSWKQTIYNFGKSREETEFSEKLIRFINEDGSFDSIKLFCPYNSIIYDDFGYSRKKNILPYRVPDYFLILISNSSYDAFRHNRITSIYKMIKSKEESVDRNLLDDLYTMWDNVEQYENKKEDQLLQEKKRREDDRRLAEQQEIQRIHSFQ